MGEVGARRVGGQQKRIALAAKLASRLAKDDSPTGPNIGLDIQTRCVLSRLVCVKGKPKEAHPICGGTGSLLLKNNHLTFESRSLHLEVCPGRGLSSSTSFTSLHQY